MSKDKTHNSCSINRIHPRKRCGAGINTDDSDAVIPANIPSHNCQNWSVVATFQVAYCQRFYAPIYQSNYLKWGWDTIWKARIHPPTAKAVIKVLSQIFFFLFFFTHLNSQTINIEKTTIDFGGVREGDVLKYFLSIDNPSKNTLHVGIRSSCDCITVTPSRFALAPEHTKKLSVVIDTKGYSGKFSENIFFQSNDEKNPYFSIDVRGEIKGKSVKEKGKRKKEKGRRKKFFYLI